MNMPPHAERGAATKSRLLCRNLSRLMKSMRTALGAPARCTARCGVSPTSTMPCRATIKSRTFWQRWAGFILIFLPTAGRSFALSASACPSHKRVMAHGNSLYPLKATCVNSYYGSPTNLLGFIAKSICHYLNGGY